VRQAWTGVKFALGIFVPFIEVEIVIIRHAGNEYFVEYFY